MGSFRTFYGTWIDISTDASVEVSTNVGLMSPKVSTATISVAYRSTTDGISAVFHVFSTP